ncbi:MAG: TolC family protein [Mangrovibacterium sp.]
MKAFLFTTILLTGFFPLAVNGQQPADSVLSLKACIQLSFANNLKLRQAQLETDKSNYQLKETISSGLPQISGFASIDDYFNIPVNMVSGEIVGQPGTMVPIQLGTKYTTNAGLQVGQIIYNASYFASVRLFKKACGISNLNLEQNKEELAFNIARMYLFIQITNKQLVLLDSNLVAFRKVYAYSEQHYRNGFILKADMDRVTVAINNLETERENLLLARNQQLNMLKYLMGITTNQDIALNDVMTVFQLPVMPADTTFENQIEMKILEQKKELAIINMKLTQTASIPSLSSYAGYSYQSPVEKIGDMNNDDNWYKTSFIGLKLTVPIFEGNRVKSKVNQNRIELEQVKNSQQDLQNELNIKHKNAFEKYNTNLSLESKLKTNMDLAGDVFEITNEQYSQGLKSFTDVLNAQSEYNTSHLSWLNSILQIKLSELEIIKINGVINSLFL